MFNFDVDRTPEGIPIKMPNELLIKKAHIEESVDKFMWILLGEFNSLFTPAILDFDLYENRPAPDPQAYYNTLQYDRVDEFIEFTNQVWGI